MPSAVPEPVNVGVVDDDENLRRSFARLLRASGMRPFTYPSAEAFLAEAGHLNFDCLVLDVQLPGMSGIELHEHLNALGNETAVVFITAYDDLGSRDKACAMGCAGYFRKSDSGKDVLNAIERVVARWRPGP
jgi:FixJ family two-component response regulator